MKKNASIERRVEALLSKMTLKEKASMLAGKDAWQTMPIERLGIPALSVTDGPHGVRSCDPASGRPVGPATAFPTGSAMAATWNPALIEKASGAMAEETLAMECDILLGPCVNIARTPLAGRNFEAYAEDPHLAGRIGIGWVRGLQRKGVGASLKHFACNNQEFERFRGSSEVDERTLREIYLAQFEAIVKETQPWTVMCAYNRINGVYASQHDFLLNKVLRNEWGFEGIVVSDWGANHTIIESVEGGLDIEMPGPAKYAGRLLCDAVNNWQIEQETVDRAVRRILRVLIRSGRVDGKRPAGRLNTPDHHALARRVAEESIVLLKNDGGLLPLAGVTSVAVIGPTADDFPISGGGSAFVTPPHRTTPLAALRRRLGAKARVQHEGGCDYRTELPMLNAAWTRPAGGRGQGLRAEYFNNRDHAGKPGCVRTETNLGFWLGESEPAPGITAKEYSMRWSGTFTAPADGTHELKAVVAGDCRILLDGKTIARAPTLAETDDPNRNVHISARLELKKGRVHRLCVEFAKRPGAWLAHLRLLFGRPLDHDADSRIARAVAAAAKADVAVVCVGLPEGHETEGADRRDMELTGRQNELVRAVAKANPRTVVVLSCGAPVTMPWADDVSAIVLTHYAGMEGGEAVARVLTGAVNPSGRLAVTFPRRLEDNPSFGNYPGGRQVRYGEGVLVGYRYYDAKDVAPLFCFGHGLSYTSFAYTGLKVPARVAKGQTVRVSVQVKNTGTQAGAEVVQAYVADSKASVVRPPRELKAFEKVFLKPGEQRTVSFDLPERALSFFDPVSRRWVAEPGRFEVQVGSSSRDLRACATFELEG